MTLLELQRQSATRVLCRIADGERERTVNADITTYDDIRGVSLNGLPQEDLLDLYHSPDADELVRHIWRYFDGEPVELPADLRSEPPTPASRRPPLVKPAVASAEVLP